jgi:hypothetical protein
MIELYRFYENWSTETFTGKGFEKSPENRDRKRQGKTFKIQSKDG